MSGDLLFSYAELSMKASLSGMSVVEYIRSAGGS